jgi:uncharacterized protein (TIGR03118 family)
MKRVIHRLWHSPRKSRGRRAAPRPAVEALEDRCVPSGAGVYQQTNLIADQLGVAPIQDTKLHNAWGIAVGPRTAWVSSNEDGVSTVYNGGANGEPWVKNPLVVQIPGGKPTGQVFNGTNDFMISDGTNSAPAAFLFASESGHITGWNPTLNPPPPPSTQAYNGATVNGAIFKGIALANNGSGNFLYAADFHNNKIIVFDRTFTRTTLAGSFTDPKLPRGYAPFNILALNGKLYVTYARQDRDAEDDVPGPGHGFIDVFDPNGNFQKRLVSGGVLNSPWGLALAPADFGKFSNALLVGNFGDGRINAFDPNTGRFLGQMHDASGRPLAIDGLWGLSFGNGTTAGDRNDLLFAAGPGDEERGLFGKLEPANVDIIAVVADQGDQPIVQVLDATTRRLKFTISLGSSFRGGARVAVGDVNNDGIPDVIAGGTRQSARVRVFDGRNGAPLAGRLGNFSPLLSGRGVFVAAGDVNGDGFDDVIVSTGSGARGRVNVFSGQTGRLLSSFQAGPDTFRGGIRVAAGDVNGDGKADIIIGQGDGGSGEVQVRSGADGSTLRTLMVGDAMFHAGTFVAAGDVNGDGKADIIIGQGSGGSAEVRVFSGADGSLLGSVMAESAGFNGGVRVAAADADGDGKADIITAAGLHLSVFDGETRMAIDSFFAGGDSGGLFVGGGTNSLRNGA